MAETKYTYSISTDFPNQKVATARLLLEVRESAIVTAVDYVNTSGDDCDVWFKDELSEADQVVLGGIVAVHSGEPLPLPCPPESPSGIPLVEPQPREGSSLVIVTHNWCDKTTWYQKSTRLIGETLSDSGDHKTFESANLFWIDLSHGKVYREDVVSATYLPIVKVDGEVKTERAPWAESGGDFEVDYAAGTVTFFAEQTGAVTAAYSFAGSSLFTVAPVAGRKLVIESSEVQFADDIEMLDSIHFQPWAYNPADLPNKVAVAAATTYKTIRDYVDEAIGVYPVIPAIGGLTRGLQRPHVVFPFNYKTVKELKSSQGLEIRIWLGDDKVFGGEFSTATFYCTSKAEE